MAREDVQTNIRLPEDLKDSLTAAAAKNGRSLTAEIVQRLEHSFTPWEERPWEERWVTDVQRAVIKMMTADEYSSLLNRVKRAGGAEYVNSQPSSEPVSPVDPIVGSTPAIEEGLHAQTVEYFVKTASEMPLSAVFSEEDIQKLAHRMWAVANEGSEGYVMGQAAGSKVLRSGRKSTRMRPTQGAESTDQNTPAEREK
jgi:plasmid stability protein